MKCRNCGKEVPDTAKVCGYCGHRLIVVDTPIPIPTTIHNTEPKKKIPGWIWAVAGMGTLLLMGLVIAAIILFVPIKIDLGLSPNAPAPVVPTNPPPPVSTSVPASLPTPTHITNPTPTLLTIAVEPFNNDNDGAKLSELAQETGPGTWTANISSSTAVIFGWGWCSATQDILDNNLAHMQVQFFVDGIDMTSSMTQSPGTIDGGVCRYYRGVIRSWPVGKHTILYKLIFLEKVNDGESDYEGVNTKTYIVNVSQ